MKKLSKINEGMFKASIQRSNSNKVRKEDNLDILDFDEFYEYINTHYKKNKIWGIRYHKEDRDPTILIPLAYSEDAGPSFMYIVYNKYKEFIYTPLFVTKAILISDPDIKDKLSDTYFITKGRHMNIEDKSNKPITNSFCIEVLDTILNFVKQPLLDKESHK